MPHYHPNAWLPSFRNIQPGLLRRTEILFILEKDTSTAQILATQIDVSYSTILYHLHHLERHRIVARVNPKPPIKWVLKPVGQLTLNSYDS